MEKLRYTIIKSEKQYYNYCDMLENFLTQNKESLVEDVELLTLLIEKWDAEHTTFEELEPVQLIKALMEENNLKSKDLGIILNLSKGSVSKMLNYHKGLSKNTIRILSEHFKISQEAFNKPYKLVNEINRHFKNANLMNTKKDLGHTMAI